MKKRGVEGEVSLRHSQNLRAEEAKPFEHVGTFYYSSMTIRQLKQSRVAVKAHDSRFGVARVPDDIDKTRMLGLSQRRIYLLKSQ